MMKECEPEEGWSDTAINDMFWFDFDTICDWLGYKDAEHLEKDVPNDEMEEAEEWAEQISMDYDCVFRVAGLHMEDYRFINEDGEEEYDLDCATEDFDRWWNDMDDFQKVEVWRSYGE